VTALDNGLPVFGSLVATGVRGADTPTGDFLVRAKLPKMDMRGTTVTGYHYDIPDVPWVMLFDEDYALHGAPWRPTFGFAQSNGCVTMPVAAAKFLYDWAPRGTPVRVHY